jgi:choloylglycine hydrolase
MAYLGFDGTEADTLTNLPLNELEELLDAPFIPFDGLNERGLAVGMAAVPPGNMSPDPGKETIGSVMVIRMMLDLASTVDEAIAIFKSYNIDMTGGPPIHYLIADSSGNSVLVEFYQGELVVIPNETPWHLATNFLRASYGDSVEGVSWRYDTLFRRLSETEGQLSSQEAMNLLEDVSQANTQWSVVYGMDTGDIIVSMDRQYNKVYPFALNQPGQ